MRKRLCLSVAIVTASLATPVPAGDPMLDALRSIPPDAIGFLCIPSLEKLDADYRQTIVDLGIADLVPPMAQSLLTSVRMVPMFAAVDVKRPLLLVAMPAKTPSELGESLALIIPTSDPKPMLQGLMGEQAEDGSWNVNLFGRPLRAATGDKRLVLATKAGIARKVAANDKPFGEDWPAERRRFLEGLDLAVWVDAQQVINVFRPQIEGMMMMGLMMNMSGGALAEEQARLQKEQFDMLLNDTTGLGVGVALDRGGLDLRFGLAAKTGSDLARQWAMPTTTTSLLEGLPAGDFVFALGQVADPEQTRAAIGNIDQLFAMIPPDVGIDEEKLGEFRELVKEWLPLITAMRMSVEGLRPDADGIVGFAAIVETTDSTKWLDLVDRMAGGLGEMIGAAELEDDARQALGAVSYTPGAEKIGDLSFAHWKLDLSRIADVEAEDLATLRKIIGDEGVLVRLAAVDASRVTIAFGGGKAYAKALVDAARSGKDVLGRDAGVLKVQPHLPTEKGSVVYVAVDRLIRLIRRIAEAVDQGDEFPLNMPIVDAPLAMVGSGAPGWVRGDLFVPIELGAGVAKMVKEIKAKEEAANAAKAKADEQTEAEAKEKAETESTPERPPNQK